MYHVKQRRRTSSSSSPVLRERRDYVLVGRQAQSEGGVECSFPPIPDSSPELTV
jgi:hypothetical protein